MERKPRARTNPGFLLPATRLLRGVIGVGCLWFIIHLERLHGFVEVDLRRKSAGVGSNRSSLTVSLASSSRAASLTRASSSLTDCKANNVSKQSGLASGAVRVLIPTWAMMTGAARRDIAGSSAAGADLSRPSCARMVAASSRARSSSPPQWSARNLHTMRVVSSCQLPQGNRGRPNEPGDSILEPVLVRISQHAAQVVGHVGIQPRAHWGTWQDRLRKIKREGQSRMEMGRYMMETHLPQSHAGRSFVLGAAVLVKKSREGKRKKKIVKILPPPPPMVQPNFLLLC
jgi:hypothetical protein